MPRKERGKQYVVGKMLMGTGASYIEVASTGKISQYGTQTASLVNLKVETGASLGGTTAFGSAGTPMSQILSGSVTITVPDLATWNASGVATGTVNGVVAADKVFLTATSGLEAKVTFNSACTAANTISAQFYNTASVAYGSTAVTFYYLVVRDLA